MIDQSRVEELDERYQISGSIPAVKEQGQFGRRSDVQLALEVPAGAKIRDFVFTQSELIEPVSPQVAQLGNMWFYSFHNTQLEIHHLERPTKGHPTSEGK